GARMGENRMSALHRSSPESTALHSIPSHSTLKVCPPQMLYQNRLARSPIAEHALSSVARANLGGLNRGWIHSRRIVLSLRRRWNAIGHLPPHLAAGGRIHANIELPFLLATGKKFGSS